MPKKLTFSQKRGNESYKKSITVNSPGRVNQIAASNSLVQFIGSTINNEGVDSSSNSDDNSYA